LPMPSSQCVTVLTFSTSARLPTLIPSRNPTCRRPAMVGDCSGYL
jgi:hypothetical protein